MRPQRRMFLAFMGSQGLEVSIKQEGSNFHVIGKMGEGTAAEEPVHRKTGNRTKKNHGHGGQ